MALKNVNWTNEWNLKMCIESNHNHYIPVAWLGVETAVSQKPAQNGITSSAITYLHYDWGRLSHQSTTGGKWQFGFLVNYHHHKSQHIHKQTTFCCKKQNGKAAFLGVGFFPHQRLKTPTGHAVAKMLRRHTRSGTRFWNGL